MRSSDLGAYLSLTPHGERHAFERRSPDTSRKTPLLAKSGELIESSRLACFLERNPEPNSHNSDRDENVCKVITKFDSPRKPPAPSGVHQDIEDSQESKKYLAVRKGSRGEGRLSLTAI